jgi:GWxTD domain-containing protein
LFFGAGKKIDFAIDFAQYRLQENYVYLEVYYSITRQSLTYDKVEAGFKAAVNIKTYILKNEKSMLVDSLIIEDVVKSMDEISASQKFTEVSVIQVEEGNYVLNSEFMDLNSSESVSDSDSLYLKSFPENVLALSDIEFATLIKSQSEPALRFDKNGLRVIPNPSNVFGTGLPNLNFYAEVYNLEIEANAKGTTYHSNYYILDQGDKIIIEVIGRPKKKPGSSSIIHGALDVSQLETGLYCFKVVVTDDFSGKTMESKKDFQIYNMKDVIAKRTANVKPKEETPPDEFLNMDDKALDEYFGPIKYIALKGEQKLFKKLDVNGKRNFLNEFWKKRDPKPITKINEAKIKYNHLLEYANKNFSVGKKPGWKSDRARVLLKYGQPDEVQRKPSNMDHKAYQIWLYYNVQGGVEFVFVDIRRIRDLQLVHSTHPDEVREYEWFERYTKL